MKLSQEGAEALMKREGFRNKAYRDTKGILTIGVGHTGPDVHEDLVWDDQQVRDTFMRDTAWAQKAVNTVQQPLNQNMYDALVSFVFNIGEGAFMKSTLKKFLDMGLYKQTAMEFDRWHLPPEITGRRNGERDQFLKPV